MGNKNIRGFLSCSNILLTKKYSADTQHTACTKYSADTQHTAYTKYSADTQHTAYTKYSADTQHTACTKYSADTQHTACTITQYHALYLTGDPRSCSLRFHSAGRSKLSKTILPTYSVPIRILWSLVWTSGRPY